MKSPNICHFFLCSILFSLSGLAVEPLKLLLLEENDAGKGVNCMVKIPEWKTAYPSSEAGEFTFEQGCPVGTRVTITPKNQNTYHVREYAIQIPFGVDTVNVMCKKRTDRARANANALEKASTLEIDNLIRAAYGNALVSARLKKAGQTAEATQTLKRAYEQFGQRYGILGPVVIKGDTVTPPVDTVNRIAAIQREKHIPVTNVLDGPTFFALTNIPAERFTVGIVQGGKLVASGTNP